MDASRSSADLRAGARHDITSREQSATRTSQLAPGGPDTPSPVCGSSSKEHVAKKIDVLHTFRTVPEFLVWVKDFTKIDYDGMAKVEPELWAVHKSWPGIFKKIQTIKCKIEARAAVEKSHQHVKNLEQVFSGTDSDTLTLDIEGMIALCPLSSGAQDYLMVMEKFPTIGKVTLDKAQLALSRAQTSKAMAHLRTMEGPEVWR